jgi:hypothetical protein
LTQYLKWLSTGATRLSTHTKNTYTNQASQILRVAHVSGGFYLQRKKPSVFGRNYYAGISIQNVNKELRRAILGDCFEYDIMSSAIEWKMGYARSLVREYCPKEDVDKVFSTTIIYLVDKKNFINCLRVNVFKDATDSNKDFHNGLLKQAFNAIGFGARLRTQGWRDESGNWNNPALVDILTNPDDRERFVNDKSVKKFINQQDMLDEYLLVTFCRDYPQLMTMPELQTASGRISNSKFIAFLYQHAETQVMDIAREYAASQGRTPLASVHDAVFFKRKLSGIIVDMQMEMRYRTGNPYWRLAAKEIKGYQATRDASSDALSTNESDYWF